MTQLSFRQYEQIDALNFSVLRWMATSPLHYRHWREHRYPDNDSFRLGRAVHAAVFEPDRFLEEFVAYEGKRHGKSWQQFQDDNCNATILKATDMETAVAIGDAVRAHPVAAELLADPKGEAESTLEWTEDCGLRCKARLDWVAPTLGDLDDLKTTRGSVGAWAFSAALHRYQYYLQLAFYRRGYQAVHGVDLTPAIIAVESTTPYDVAVHELGEATLEVAEIELDDLLERVVRCQETGEYPGQYPRRNIIDLPKWRFAEQDDIRDLDLEMSDG